MLPKHDEITLFRRVIEAACITSAAGLLVWQAVRLLTSPGIFTWSTLAVLLLGMLAADFVSGLVHWTADTWFEETMPVLGRRLLRPFRVHHVNPDDFLRRGFLTVNGDVSLICLPFLAAVFALPLETVWGRLLGVFVVSFAAVGLPTNQVHQWAHMPAPPRWVRWLQRRRIILSREDHWQHHHPPYAQFYCIATGWLNRPLSRIDFFRRAERVVSAWTGMQPRADDDQFQLQLQAELATHIVGERGA
ncbi:MAG: fatty acid desaturase CarF family protein [Planctomycetaceae bacterium]